MFTYPDIPISFKKNNQKTKEKANTSAVCVEVVYQVKSILKCNLLRIVSACC